MGQLGIRIVNGLLFTLCCFQVASVFNKVSADLLMPAAASFAVTAPSEATAATSWDDRKPILDRNLFGAQILPVARPISEPSENLEETKLPLQLLGTLLSDDSTLSTAAIAETGNPDHELLREGDVLARHARVRVAAIERGRVILQNGDRREELLLSEDPIPPTGRPSLAKRDSRRGRRPSVRRRPTVPTVPTPAAIAEQLSEFELGPASMRNARKLLEQAKITPKWDDGAMQGMEVRDIEPGSFYDKLGLKNGDVIQSFNGIKLDSTAAGAKVLNQFVEADEFDLELTDGSLRTVSANELADLLGE
jgi:general secretion pathway protein C